MTEAPDRRRPCPRLRNHGISGTSAYITAPGIRGSIDLHRAIIRGSKLDSIVRPANPARVTSSITRNSVDAGRDPCRPVRFHFDVIVDTVAEQIEHFLEKRYRFPAELVAEPGAYIVATHLFQGRRGYTAVNAGESLE